MREGHYSTLFIFLFKKTLCFISWHFVGITKFIPIYLSFFLIFIFFYLLFFYIFLKKWYLISWHFFMGISTFYPYFSKLVTFASIFLGIFTVFPFADSSNVYDSKFIRIGRWRGFLCISRREVSRSRRENCRKCIGGLPGPLFLGWMAVGTVINIRHITIYMYNTMLNASDLYE